jgi:hypothetical protein
VLAAVWLHAMKVNKKNQDTIVSWLSWSILMKLAYAGMIGLMTLQQGAPSHMTLHDSNLCQWFHPEVSHGMTATCVPL